MIQTQGGKFIHYDSIHTTIIVPDNDVNFSLLCSGHFSTTGIVDKSVIQALLAHDVQVMEIWVQRVDEQG